MEIEITVKVTVPDGIANFLGFGVVAQPLVYQVHEAMLAVQLEHREMIESFEVTSETPAGTVIGHGWSQSAPESRSQRPAREFGTRGATVASEPRRTSLRPATGTGGNSMSGSARPAAPKGNGTGKTGRPPTLHDHSASDGDVVRASGTRGIETLVNSGIKVYRIDGNRKIRVGADGKDLNTDRVVNASGGRQTQGVTLRDVENAPVIAEQPPRPKKRGSFTAKTRGE